MLGEGMKRLHPETGHACKKGRLLLPQWITVGTLICPAPTRVKEGKTAGR